MSKKIIALCTSVICALLLTINIAQAKPQLHGMKTTVAVARKMSKANYHGTNILVVNWTDNYVWVDIDDLGISQLLDPISGPDNTFYVYSNFYYDPVPVSLYSEIHHHHGNWIADVDADNPSTIEIYDETSYGMSKAAGKQHHIKVSKKAGI